MFHSEDEHAHAIFMCQKIKQENSTFELDSKKKQMSIIVWMGLKILLPITKILSTTAQDRPARFCVR